MGERFPTERERALKAKQAAAHLPDAGVFHVLEEDKEAMRAAFQRRFGEDLPRTETLFAVAAIGYRMALRDKASRP